MKRIYIYQWRFLAGYGNSYLSYRRCALRKKLLGTQQGSSEKVFIATTEPFVGDVQAHHDHRLERGEDWKTIEGTAEAGDAAGE